MSSLSTPVEETESSVNETISETGSENMSTSTRYNPILIRLGLSQISMISLRRNLKDNWKYLLFSVLLAVFLSTCFSISFIQIYNPDKKISEYRNMIENQNLTFIKNLSEQAKQISDLVLEYQQLSNQHTKVQNERADLHLQLYHQTAIASQYKNEYDRIAMEHKDAIDKLSHHINLFEQLKNSTSARFNVTETENEKLKTENADLKAQHVKDQEKIDELSVEIEEKKVYKDYSEQNQKEMEEHKKRVDELLDENKNYTEEVKEWKEKFEEITLKFEKLQNETEKASTYKSYSWEDLKKAINASEIKCSDSHIRDNVISYLNEALQKLSASDRKSRKNDEICKSVRNRVSGTYKSDTWGCIMGNFSKSFESIGSIYIPFELDHDTHVQVFTLPSYYSSYRSYSYG